MVLTIKSTWSPEKKAVVWWLMRGPLQIASYKRKSVALKALRLLQQNALRMEGWL